MPQGPAPEGGAWTLVLDEARKPRHWRATADDAELPVRPLKDTDSLLAALNESIASPTGLVARVDADGVLTGVTSRDDIHEHASKTHGTPGTASVAMTVDWSWMGGPHHDLTSLALSTSRPRCWPSSSAC